MAVVCLSFGARHAAQRLLEAGVPNIIWIPADMLSEGSEKVLDKVVSPAVRMLEHKNEPAAVSKLLVTELNKLRKRNPSLCAEQPVATCG